MTLSRIIKLIAVFVVLAPLGLFYVQNAGTRVDLVFRLPGMSWYLVRSAPVPLLLTVSLATGGLVSALWFGSKAVARGRAVRSLSRQVSALEDDLALARLDRSPKVDPGSVASEPADSSDGALKDGMADFDELI